MIGEFYWTTGITLKPLGDGKWSVSMRFLDSGWCQDESTEGTLECRYVVKTDDLASQVLLLKADAERLGINTNHSGNGLALYVEGDGEEDDIPYPDNWRQLAGEIADKCGMRAIYRELDQFVPAEGETQ